jgi:hypothetical protein
MSRGLAAVVVGLALTVGACGGGGGTAVPFSNEPACRILAALAVRGEAASRIDVSDPDAFNSELNSEVASYVRTAQGLRTTLPVNLRDDVDRIIAAAQQHRFTNAKKARADLDAYAREVCKTTT